MKLTQLQINQAYQQAIQYFYQVHPDWICTIENGVLIIQLNWQHYTRDGLLYLSETDRKYRYVVKIEENGSLTDYQVDAVTENAIGLGGASLSAGAFVGERTSTHFEIDLKNRDANNRPVVTQEVSYADQVAQIVRDYFEGKGYRYYSASRNYMGWGFIATSIFCWGIYLLIQKLSGEIFPWYAFAFISFFFVLGVAMIATCHKRLNPEKVGTWAFFICSLVLLPIFLHLIRRDLFVAFVLGFLFVVFLLIGIVGLYTIYFLKR